MSKYIFIISSRRPQKRDYERFGVEYLKKKKKVIILDLSNLINDRSILLYEKIKNINIKEIKTYKDLVLFLKDKQFSYAIDFSGYSIKEIIIKFILVWFNIKIIKYLIGLKPPILYKLNDQRSKIKKIFHFSNIFFKFFKEKIITLINFFSLNIVMITGKNSQYIDFYISSAKKKLYTHSFDYNFYLESKKRRKIKNKKNYIVYIDQNFISHPDFFIKKRNPFVNKKFYIKINKLLLELKKKYRFDIKIALHPKNKVNDNFFSNKNSCYINKTAELIRDCNHILMHYSASVSYGVLFKKPITFITSDELNNIRQGAQITQLSKELKSQLINIDNYKKNFLIKKKFDKKAYIKYSDQYIKHPKSSGENSWTYLLKNIY